MDQVIEWFGLVFVFLNLLSFVFIALLYGPRIYAVLRMPEDVKARLISDYEHAGLNEASI